MTFDPAIQKLYVQNVTLRDAMHATRRECELDHAKAIARALDMAKVDAIEVAHSDGLQKSVNCRSPDPMPALSASDSVLGTNGGEASPR